MELCVQGRSVLWPVAHQLSCGRNSERLCWTQKGLNCCPVPFLLAVSAPPPRSTTVNEVMSSLLLLHNAWCIKANRASLCFHALQVRQMSNTKQLFILVQIQKKNTQRQKVTDIQTHTHTHCLHIHTLVQTHCAHTHIPRVQT